MRNLITIILVYVLLLLPLGCGGTSDSGDNVVKGFNQLRESTFVVAASDASTEVLAGADYVCDGTADEVQIQAAIGAISALTGAPGGRIILSEGTFTLGSRITSTDSNLTIEGQGDSTVIDGTGITVGQSPLIKISGSVTATNTTLTGTLSPNAVIVNVTDASSFSADDWIRIRSDVWFNEGSGTKYAEIRQIESIASNAITLKTGVRFEALVGNSATIDLMSMLENITLKNFKLLSETGDLAYGVLIGMTSNARIENVTFEQCQDRAIELADSVGALITGCNINRSNRAGLGYGVAIDRACRDVRVTDNNFVDNRHAVTWAANATYGVQINTVVANNTVEYFSGAPVCAFGFHNTADRFLITGNAVTGQGLAALTGINGSLVDNIVYCGTPQAVVELDTLSKDMLVDGNHLSGVGGSSGLIIARGDRNTISNNHVTVSNMEAITVTNDFNHLSINNNTIRRTGGSKTLVEVRPTTQTGTSTGLYICDNTLIAGGFTGIQVKPSGGSPIVNIDISGNKIYSASAGINFDSGTTEQTREILVSGNHISEGTNYGIYVKGYSHNMEVSGNFISDVSTGFFTPTSGSATSYTVENNHFYNCTTEVNDNSLDTSNVSYRGNTGFATVNSGSVSSADGTYQAVAHGLDVTPLARDVQVFACDSQNDSLGVSSGTPPTATYIYVMGDSGEKFIWRVDTED